MRFFGRNKGYQETGGAKQLVESATGELPIAVSARTGLASKDDAILRRVPVDYEGKNVEQVLEYLVGADLSDSELPFAESIRKELGARGSVVMANGKIADLKDDISKYLVEREHKLPDGSMKKYRELEIEVSAVQQGGYRFVR